jgi:hypothetical protein
MKTLKLSIVVLIFGCLVVIDLFLGMSFGSISRKIALDNEALVMAPFPWANRIDLICSFLLQDAVILNIFITSTE